jgi:hypothetical protein
MGDKRVRGAAALLIAALVIAGCSSSTTDVTVPNTPEQNKTDRAVATRAVLHLTDLPDGYRAVVVKSPSANRSTDRTLLACLRLADARGRSGRIQVTGAQFLQALSASQARQVKSGVIIHTTSADMKKPFAVLGQSRSATCLTAYFRTRFADDESLSKLHPRDLVVRTLPMKSIPAVGDERAGFRGTFTLSAAGQVVNTSFDYFYVRRGRAVAILVVQGLNTTFPPAQAERLLRTMVDRLGGAA